MMKERHEFSAEDDRLDKTQEQDKETYTSPELKVHGTLKNKSAVEITTITYLF